jgi:hypothetical protein
LAIELCLFVLPEDLSVHGIERLFVIGVRRRVLAAVLFARTEEAEAGSRAMAN